MRLVTAVVVVSLMLLFGCGRKEPEPQTPVTAESPSPISSAMPDIVSEDMGFSVSEFDTDLEFNQVEPGSVSFFMGGDRETHVELTSLPDVQPGDLDAAYTAIDDRFLKYLSQGVEILRSDVATELGRGFWVAYEHTEDGEKARSGWLVAPHPNRRELIVVRVFLPDGLDVEAARDEALALVGALRSPS
jgi:hypothetical protein